MTTARNIKPSRDTLNLRIPAAERNLIDRAAESTGKTRTDFILEAARRAAEEALLDRALKVVSPEVYDEFLARLERRAQADQISGAWPLPQPIMGRGLDARCFKRQRCASFTRLLTRRWCVSGCWLNKKMGFFLPNIDLTRFRKSLITMNFINTLF